MEGQTRDFGVMGGLYALGAVCGLYAILGVGEDFCHCWMEGGGGEQWDFYGDLVMFWLMMLCGMNVGGREGEIGEWVFMVFFGRGRRVGMFTAVYCRVR